MFIIAENSPHTNEENSYTVLRLLTGEGEIITVVDKNEYAKLMQFVSKTDPKAFITIYNVSEISYQPKPR